MEYNGIHLCLDIAFRETPSIQQILRDENHGKTWMQEVVKVLDMTEIVPPISVRFPHALSEMTRTLQSLEAEGLADCATAVKIRNALDVRLDTAGYSALLMIAESHMTVHTFPNGNFVSIDAYSCKEFDVDVFMQTIDKWWAPAADRKDRLTVVDRRIFCF